MCTCHVFLLSYHVHHLCYQIANNITPISISLYNIIHTVILDLKGYQYRGTIRPGPTAMIVALTRDGQFKVESIVDEFVTLDTNTKTNVMAKLDAVVKGDMDESYQVREENVNAKNKRGKKAGDNGDGTEEEGGGGSKKGKKKASTAAAAAGNAAKKRKTK